MYFRAFEPSELRFVQKFLKRDMTVVDVGANIGLFSCLAASHVLEGQVVAIEPVRDTFDQLIRNVNFKSFHAINVALSDVAGKSQMINDHSSKDSSNGFFRIDSENNASGRHVEVEVCRLDEILTRLKITKVDFLKIDVEGHELKTLDGCGKFLHPDFINCVLFEVFVGPNGLDQGSREVVLKLVNQGFGIHQISRLGFLRRIESFERLRTNRRSALNLVARIL